MLRLEQLSCWVFPGSMYLGQYFYNGAVPLYLSKAWLRVEQIPALSTYGRKCKHPSRIYSLWRWRAALHSIYMYLSFPTRRKTSSRAKARRMSSTSLEHDHRVQPSTNTSTTARPRAHEHEHEWCRARAGALENEHDVGRQPMRAAVSRSLNDKRGLAWAWTALHAQNASPWLFANFRDLKRPQHVPRASARAHTWAMVFGWAPGVPRSTEHDKRPRPEEEKIRWAKETHINLIKIIFSSDASERSICSAHSAPFRNAALWGIERHKPTMWLLILSFTNLTEGRSRVLHLISVFVEMVNCHLQTFMEHSTSCLLRCRALYILVLLLLLFFKTILKNMERYKNGNTFVPVF